MTDRKSKKRLLIPRNPTVVSQILTALLSEAQLNESELARRTNLPQTTISRLMLGETGDPRISTLKPLAKFFNVSIEQILGEEALVLPSSRSTWLNIPLLSWDDVIPWLFKRTHFDLYKAQAWLATERKISPNSFAILAKPFMEPHFKTNSLLIVDPDLSAIDSQYMVVSFDNQTVTVRQVSLDQTQVYLKHFDLTLPTLILQEQHKQLGIIVEARIPY